MPKGLPPLQPSTLVGEIAETLRHAILDGQLEPGAHVNETAVADQLETSRGPVREALRALEREGLLVYRPRRGSFVRELTSQDIYEIYTLRAHLEALAVRLALPVLTQEDLDELNHLVGQMEAGEDTHISGMLRADAKFHGHICRLAHHGQLYESWERLNVPTGILFISIIQSNIVTPSQVARRHQRIADAIASRDLAVVESTLLEHYSIVAEQLRATARSSDN